MIFTVYSGVVPPTCILKVGVAYSTETLVLIIFHGVIIQRIEISEIQNFLVTNQINILCFIYTACLFNYCVSNVDISSFDSLRSNGRSISE